MLTKPDFSKMQVVKEYARTVVAPAIDYWRTTIDNKKGAEVARFKVARIFNPLHVLGNQISVADIDSLKIFRLSEHPLIRPHIEGMKSELIKYHALVKSIKPLDQRKDAKGKDTFVLSDWWRCNSGELPHFAFVLRAVLTNAPNSCPPERLFSMFSHTHEKFNGLLRREGVMLNHISGVSRLLQDPPFRFGHVPMCCPPQSQVSDR